MNKKALWCILLIAALLFSGAYAESEGSAEKIEAFVIRCYQLFLDRDADQDELRDWVEAMSNGTTAAADLIDSFIRNEAFENRGLSDEDKVEILYRTMLGREADAEGKAGWVNALGKGYTLQQIINGICGSPEFMAVCSDYGISAGTLKIAAKTVNRKGITPEGDEAEAPAINRENSSESINEENPVICEGDQCEIMIPPGL